MGYISQTATNGYYSFMVGPDGSKEGWDRSDEGNLHRDTFIDWLDGDRGCTWAEVRYGDDNDINRVERHSGEDG